jgi:DNA-binding HxlR family transcriptional regulator
LPAPRDTSPAGRQPDITLLSPDPGDHTSEDDECRQVLQILTLIGDKWTILVVGQLRDRTLRFGELQRVVTGISQRMLTRTLRQLERDGLLTRTMHPRVPPRVEYALTPLGTTLLESAATLAAWATTHRQEITDRRRRYDANHSSQTP